MCVKLIISFILLSLSTLSPAAVTWAETRAVYNLLIKANHLSYTPLVLSSENEVNGYTDGFKVVITMGALKSLNQSEMALLLGHELAHVKHNDADTDLGGKYQEDRADYYGSDYAEKIGYGKCEQAKFFLKLYLAYGNNGGRDDPHSPNMLRFKRLSRGCF